ncbi:DUF6978 family protein [Enterococcus faecalis]
MDINSLDNTEVQELIHSLKKPTRLFALSEINEKISTMFGKISISESVIGIIDSVEYTLCIYRGKRDPHRFSINLRFSNHHHQLIRLDIGSGHNNPDGSKITGDHIHIYNKNFPKRDSYAYSLDIHDFPNVENMIDAFYKFSMYTNIKEL